MKTPRSFTFKDHPSYRADVGMPSSDTGLPYAVKIYAQLNLINALNDMVPNLAGFGQLPYLPGDLIACKLNLVKLKNPRRNPWYKPALCPCDRRAAVNNGTEQSPAIRSEMGEWHQARTSKRRRKS